MKLVAGLVIAAGLTLSTASAAFADGAGDGWVDRGSGTIGAGAGSSSPSPGGGGGGGSGGGPVCTYTPVDADMSAIAEDMAAHGWGPPRSSGDGQWMRKICPDGTGTVVWVPGAPQVDPRVLAQQALDQSNVPLPGVGMNPGPPHDAVVNMATWLWVENFGAVNASASAGTVTVTVTATPVAVRWSMGNGDVVTCQGPGTRYDSAQPADAQHTDCSYTYRRSSASAPSGTFVVQTSVTWDVTWTATGIVAGGSLGPLTRTTSTPVRVSEIQTVNQ